MKNLETKCIVLGSRNLGEKDKIVFIYSDKIGKIRVVAKGARNINSKFNGHLEILNHATVSLYFGPKNIILREITTERNLLKTSPRLEILSSGLQIAEITNQIIFENQSLENLEKLLRITSKTLIISKKPSLIAFAYIIKLLDKYGIIPDFKTTKTSLPEKYCKFLHYLKEKSLSEIENVFLTKEETNYIKNFLKKIIEEQTKKTLFHL